LKILCFLFAAAADRRRHFAGAAAVAGKNSRRAADRLIQTGTDYSFSLFVIHQ